MAGHDRLIAPGLLAHLFLRAAPQGDDTGWESLRSAWRDITGQFGLHHPVAGLAVPGDLPVDRAIPADGRGLLAAAERHADSVWQAAAWADQGVFCVSAMIAPPRDSDCGPAWSDLAGDWRDAVARARRDGALGEAQIYLALLPAAPGGRGTSDRALRLVRAAAPEPPGTDWWRHWDTFSLGSPATGAHEVLVWELGDEAGDGRAIRRLAVIAPETAERLVDQFLWTSGDGRPAPLTRHLMHAARLRYQIRVFDDGGTSRRLRDDLRLLGEDLWQALTPGTGLEPVLEDRDWLPTRLDRLHAAMLMLRTRLADMRQAVAILDENMRRAVALPEAARAVGPLSEDRELVTWFTGRLDDEVTRLDTTLGQARSAGDFLAGRSAALAHPPDRAPARTRTNGVRPSRQTGPPERWAVILTALNVEYQAIREFLAGPIGERKERGTLYETGTLSGARGSWHVAIAETGPGSAAAGVHLERAATVFSPEVALFVGVAGGFKDVARGDVVAADAVYDYEGGKSLLGEYRSRMKTHLPSHPILQRALRVAGENRWQRRIRPVCPQPPPAAFVKPIVTGGKVVAHDRSEVALLIDRYASDAVAVEMEGYGFLEGAHLNPGMGALVIRGISDLLSGKDEASDEYWQPVASRHAAAFAVEFLDRLGASQPQPASGS